MSKQKNPSTSERLQQKREELDISLESASRQTKIPLNHLQKFESGYDGDDGDDFYMNNQQIAYADFLGLKLSETKQKKAEHKTIKIRQKVVISDFVSSKFAWLVSSLVVFIFVLGYVFFQLFLIFKPPTIVINSPKNFETIKSDRVKFVGHTSKGADLFLNDINIEVDDDGNFSKEFYLSSGLNEIEIKSVNQKGSSNLITYDIVADFD